MLPDFVLTVPVAGTPRRFAACDVPAYVFFHEHPNAFGGTRCYADADREQQATYREQHQRWATRVLTRVILAPALTPETAHRLGKAREDLGIAYLRAVGLMRASLDTPAPELLSRPWKGPRPWARDAIAARVAIPESNLREKIRMMAAKTRRSPWKVWSMPLSEWVWTWRVAIEDELRRRADGTVARRSASSLIELVGMADGDTAA